MPVGATGASVVGDCDIRSEEHSFDEGVVAGRGFGGAGVAAGLAG